MALGLVIVVVLAGGAYLSGFVAPGISPDYPFDGRWKVSVDSLTGCLNNEPRSYIVSVEGGSINEPNFRFPKTGLVSREGEFRIESHDSAGKLMNTQMGKIVGQVGKGHFKGGKPGCNGNVEMARIQ